MKCDVCNQDKPIVIVCMIGCKLCTDCQAAQNRISHEELTEYILRPTYSKDTCEHGTSISFGGQAVLCGDCVAEAE